MSSQTGASFAAVCLLGWAALSACSSAGETRGGTQSESQSDAMVEAEFRHAARETYRAARSRSCEPSSVDYATALSDEVAALRNFEAQATASLGFHLDVAQADVEFVDTGCWVDDDPDFAKRHVEMARKNLSYGLEVLSRLGSSLTPQAPNDGLPAALSAAFRARIASVVTTVNPACQLSNRAASEEITAAATARLAQFEQQIGSTAFALHFAIAETDVLYLQSITLTECASPQVRDPKAIGAQIDSDVASQIASIRSEFLTRESG